MNRKRHLFILPLPPPVHGSSVVGQFIRECDQINKHREIHYLNVSTSETIDEIGKNAITKGWRFFKIIFETFKELVSGKYDLCYLAIAAKGVGFYKDAMVAIMIKLFRNKLIIHLHNKGIKDRQGKWPDNWIYNFVLRDTDVILLSEYLYPDIEKFADKDHISYCPNGIPELNEYCHTNTEKKYGEAVQILFLSNLIESKGVYILLQACSFLYERKLPFHCTFIGEEGDILKSHFKKEVKKLELESIVEYKGPKYGDEKSEYFKQADIFTLPTLNDCFPLVLLEAMQFGLPIITTPEGGICDIVQDEENGFLVPQNDPLFLANRLELLINTPKLREEMGQKGRRVYEEKFTLTSFEERFDRILSKIEKGIH